MSDNATLLPPYSRQAEEALLGSLLIDPELIIEVSDMVKPEYFYREVNGYVYKAMVKMAKAEQAIDVLTISDELRSVGVLDDIGGQQFVIGLLNVVPTSANVHGYARVVTDKAIRRKMIVAARLMANLAYDESIDLDEAVVTSYTALQEAVNLGTSKPITIYDEASAMIDYLTEVTNQPEKIFTGFRDLDMVMGGARPTQLIYLAGRPAMGKSALMSNIAVNAAKEGNKCLIFSLEMRPSDMLSRMVAAEMKINSRDIMDNNLGPVQRKHALAAAGHLSQLPITFASSWDASPGSFLSECRRVQARSGLDIAFIDYLQLMRSDEKIHDLNAKVSSISRNLKLAADTLDIPIVVLSQLNRALESRKDKRPQLSDLRDSGSIEQDADIVLFVYREAYYDYSAPQNQADIIAAKNRNGPTGTVTLGWEDQYTRFYTVERVPVDLNNDNVFRG
jgi:replicative DNA helicase